MNARPARHRGLHFDLTDQHVALLRRARVTWDDCEFGAPAIDPKRPYGNSHVLADIAEELYPEFAEVMAKDNDGEDVETWIEAHEEELTTLHGETMTALQVVLAAGQFTPGRYVREDPYTNEWRPAENAG